MNTQFKKGVLDLCVLSILNQGDCYGYEIVNKITDFMEISEGSIYPLLRRLKKDHLVTSYLKESIEGPPRKYYKLSDDGVSAYHQLLAEWQEFQESINRLVDTGREE